MSVDFEKREMLVRNSSHELEPSEGTGIGQYAIANMSSAEAADVEYVIDHVIYMHQCTLNPEDCHQR